MVLKFLLRCYDELLSSYSFYPRTVKNSWREVHVNAIVVQCDALLSKRHLTRNSSSTPPPWMTPCSKLERPSGDTDRKHNLTIAEYNLPGQTLVHVKTLARLPSSGLPELHRVLLTPFHKFAILLLVDLRVLATTPSPEDRLLFNRVDEITWMGSSLAGKHPHSGPRRWGACHPWDVPPPFSALFWNQ